MFLIIVNARSQLAKSQFQSESLMKYVAYYRVSTQKQGNSGLGLDAQRDAVMRHARSRGAEVIAEFTEIESGRNSQRPQLRAARSIAVRSKAVLLIAKLDRLARSVSFISTLMADSRLEIEACDMPAANRLSMHIMAAVAENEAEAISQRTSAALQQAIKRGVKLGFAHPSRAKDAGQARQRGVMTSKLRADRFAATLGPTIETMRKEGLTFQEIAEEFTRRRYPLARQQNVHDEPVWKLHRVRQIYRRYSFIGPRAYGMALLSAPEAKKGEN